MAVFVDYLFVFLVKSTLVALITVKACEVGYFYDLTQGRCKKCSVCPTNHIIDKVCTPNADLKCIPFTFDFPNFDSDDLSLDLEFPSSDSLEDDDGIKSKSKRVDKKSHPAANEDDLTAVDSEDRYWKTLAFALIGLLSALIIATFVVLIFVYRKLQKSIVIKQTEEGEVMDDADSGYVVIRAIHHFATPRGDNPLLGLYPCENTTECHHPYGLSSSGLTSVDSGRPMDSLSISTQPPTTDDGKAAGGFLPKTYRPQRRLLNYDADDVFESSDDNSSIHHTPAAATAADPRENLQPLMGVDSNSTSNT